MICYLLPKPVVSTIGFLSPRSLVANDRNSVEKASRSSIWSATSASLHAWKFPWNCRWKPCSSSQRLFPRGKPRHIICAMFIPCLRSFRLAPRQKNTIHRNHFQHFADGLRTNPSLTSTHFSVPFPINPSSFCCENPRLVSGSQARTSHITRIA